MNAVLRICGEIFIDYNIDPCKSENSTECVHEGVDSNLSGPQIALATLLEIAANQVS